MSKPIKDMALLQPAFRAKVEALLARMRERGFDPLVWETYRTPARALEMSKKGTGVPLRADGTIPVGMHQLGLAVDIVSKSKLWTPPKAFWDALGAEAKALGLTWGGTWKRVDKPHVQAVPVGKQAAARAAFAKDGAVGVARLLAGSERVA